MTITPEIIDIIGYISASLTTASFLPQAFLTLKTKDTQSLSLSMYTMFTLGVLGWLVYGIFIANKVIIVANIITLILATSILGFKIYNMLTNKE
ncbi:MAG: glutathione synthetase [Methylococcales bacterium]|nr:glutathione synthetase [Methylococcales bacterium]